MKTAIFVINVKSAVDRRLAMSETLSQMKSPWEFFEACESLHQDLTYKSTTAINHHGRELRQGELACYSSHYMVWKKIVAEGLEQAVVLEDDLLVDPTMLDLIAATDLDALKIPYLRLFHKHPTRVRIRELNFIAKERFLIQLLGRPAGTQGYVITRMGALQFISHCSTIKRPIDREMDRYWAHGIKNMCIFPFPIVERNVTSTIGNSRYEPLDAPWQFGMNKRVEGIAESMYMLRLRASERLRRR